MHEAIANITFNSNKIPISKEQIKAILDYFFDKFIDCENITDIKYIIPQNVKTTFSKSLFS